MGTGRRAQRSLSAGSGLLSAESLAADASSVRSSRWRRSSTSAKRPSVCTSLSPPLSVQIRTLEERLGARLFERDRRHVALTEVGAFMLQRARDHLAKAEKSCLEAGRIARGEKGALSIGYTTTATYEVLPALLRRFRERSPSVRLELVELGWNLHRVDPFARIAVCPVPWGIDISAESAPLIRHAASESPNPRS